MKKIAVGADAVGLLLKDEIVDYLKNEGYEVDDLGVKEESDKTFYANVAEKVALAVRDEDYDRGLLFCGTGIGMSIAANKVPGVYATVCHDPYSAERASLSNNAKIITMGYRVIGKETAKVVLKHWLDNDFEEGCKSQSNVDEVGKLDNKYRK
ncbi:RpiB/LacA/LacB family sugar-phosphate isomerase [Anaerofustis sp.]|uniref:RpiB/LacA/LacB family sugar-phosphate isomerase n=1 Tax=Anaerofustis sp. TaxID=1872517 RepID=UPI0025B979A0|nr:RpiB/LacA/LacB family sugar-phosphate isomerase [Anaerofustis sp.]